VDRTRTWSIRVIRRFLVVETLLAVLAGTVSAPFPALGAGPPHGGTPLVEVPPLVADGPVVLPNGRVLPVQPAWVHESSVQAEMLAAHAGDRIDFVPGDPPQPRGGDNATLALSEGVGDLILPLALAPASGTTATLAATATLPNGMRKEVFGFLPYWLLDAGSLQWMQYQLVTTIAYFGVAARPDGTLATSSGGSPTPGWSGWNSSAMTGVINAAHARGVRVVLTVTMMAWDGGAGQAALLGSATARGVLVSAIVAAVRDRAADGVNLDFEPVYTPQRDQYTSFVRQLKAALVAAGVGSYLTVDTTGGAATWATGYDLAGLSAVGAADAVFVMGYDYSWSGSARAGAVAPMDSPYILDVRESVDDYLAAMPAAKIIWGVPYYGRTWQTMTGDPNSPTRSGASDQSKAYYYTGARTLAATHGRRWDDVGKVPWFAYYDAAHATWVEGYYDDAASLAVKFDMVNAKGLAGTGMWTLLMDQGDNALWGLIANKFVNDTTPPAGGIRLLPAQAEDAAITVRWAATDVGSGVKSYSVQVRDRSRSTWVPWLTGTTATSGTFGGVPGRSYEFRVAAVDYKGNAQPWLAPAAMPGSSLAVGGFALVTADLLNVRSGAGTGFSVLDQLSAPDLVAVLAGPIDSGGYQWYQVQFSFGEWPSSDYPRLGWVAAGSPTTPYLAPAKPPNVISVAPGAIGPGLVPTVVGRYPASGAWNIAPTVAPAARFDRVVVGVSAGSFVLRRPDGSTVAATVADEGDGLQFTLRPSAPLAQGTTYTLSLTSAIMGVEGGALAPVSWSFTTWGTLQPASTGPTTYNPAAPVVFKMGTHTGYQFSSTGAVTASKSYTLVKDSGASTSTRRTISNQSGTWLYITNGVWAGYWMRESSVLYLKAAPISAPAAPNATFSPTVRLVFKKGTHTGYKLSASGAMTAQKTYTLLADSGANTSTRTTIPNQSGAWFYVTNGVWAGYWLRVSDVLFLAPG